ncbi:MAG TPA: hypothetical protein VH277_19310 [Gemmatimonadaceae bacterium]|nr:hypothetical protein [Gemmatimonadaceae bacterium]
MSRTMLTLALAPALALIVLVRPPRPATAVTISPTAIYLSNRDRAATFELYNGGDSPAEVELSVAYGYPVSDSLGRVDVRILDTVPSGEPSAAAWLRLDPQRVLLQPKQRQLVRVDVDPPPAIPVGEYWARLLVRSRTGLFPASPAGEAASENGPRTRMRIETLSITALNYRNGSVTSGVQVDSARARTTDSSASLTLDLQRSGNAAFLGRLTVELRSTKGQVLDEVSEDVAVYRTLRRVFTFSRPDRSASTFRYRLTTDRDDLDPGVVTHAEPVLGQVRFAP